MLTITHNIDDVIADLERLEAAAKTVPEAVLQPAIYVDDLTRLAEGVLDSLTEQAEKDAIPTIVASLTHWVTNSVMAFELISAEGEQALDNAGVDDFGFQRLEPMKDLIAEWIRLYKDMANAELYSEYWGDYEAFAEHIIATIKNDPQAWLSATGKDDLIPFLREQNPEAFNSVFGLTGLPDLRATELLTAVLAAWHDLMGVRVTEVALQHIDKALSPLNN